LTQVHVSPITELVEVHY